MADDVPLAFYQPAGLFLKPDSKVTIQVRLPEISTSGVSISNWEVMEKIKALSKPEEFRSLRVEKYSREIIRFEGEFETVRSMRKVILLLNGKCMKLSGLSDLLKIRAKQHEPHYPTKKEWEDYFMDRGVETFDDGRPGERPDTLQVRGLPVKWFISQTSDNKPCPRMLTLAFQKFGNVRQVGICNPTSTSHHSSEFSSFGPGSTERTLYFTTYIQYEKYTAFCIAMDALKGMKLMRLECGGKEAVASIDVDFDRSGYLSKKNVMKRQRAEEQRKRELEEEQLKEEERKTERERKRRLEQEAEEEARAAKKMKKMELKRQKKERQALLVAQLKSVAVKRREEAQQLLSVLLAGAAEARWAGIMSL